MYGIPLFFVWLVTLIIGGMITTVSVAGPEQIQSFCEGNGMDDGERGQWVAEQIDTIDDAINSYSSTFMCSYECPCTLSDSADWWAMSDAALSKYGRTKQQATSISGNNTPATNSAGEYRLITTASDGKYYKSFSECNLHLQAKYVNNTDTSSKSDVPTGTTIETSVKVLEYFESKYQCSGICTPSLFYYSLNLDEGVPKTTCLSHVKTEIGD